MLCEPFLHNGIFSRGAVFGHQVQCLVLGGLAVDLAQEIQPLGVGVAWVWRCWDWLP